MILVTVGVHNQPLERLVEAADELASQIDEPMIIQRGPSSYIPRFAQHVVFVEEAQLLRWLSQARVVVSHAGAGTILNALVAGKPLVVVPRIAALGEVIDDHQFELAEALDERGRVVVVTELSAGSLAEAIEHAPRRCTGDRHGTGLQTALQIWLTEQASRPPSRSWWPFRRKTKHGA
jgi:beta-1,4-N-acetylglucosaminyltransferase